MKGKSALVLLVLVVSVTFAWAEDLKTVAESSNYTATSTNADVLSFCKKLAAGSAKARFTTIGTSAGGNTMGMLIIGDPVPSRPAELIYDDRIVVYIQANIHAGEVEGKEASMMLARDIVNGKHPGILDHVVILIVPNYNSDGNSHISKENRYYQPGPDEGVGRRPNDMNLDLNRDWMKLESPEARAVTGKVLTPWDPVLLIDCHTTDGSLHTEPMTWSHQLHPSGDADLLDYCWDTLLPAAAKTLKDEFNYKSIPYGNWVDRNDQTKGWRTFGHHTRYTTNYIGIRNRLGVLLETYAFANYKDRVWSSYGILLGLLRQCNSDYMAIKKMIRDADAAAYARAEKLDPEKDVLVVEVDLQSFEEPFVIETWESAERGRDEQGRRTIRPVGERVDREVKYFAKFVAKKTVPLPAHYVLEPGEGVIIDKLLQHGISVEKLTEETTVVVQRFHTSEIKQAERLFQGHKFTTVVGEWKEEEVTLPSGSYVISTAQPLGMLAAALLEPEYDDSLTTWNFFDRKLARQWGGGALPHPVLKIMTPGPLPAVMLP